MKSKFINLLLLTIFVTSSLTFGQIASSTAEEVDVLGKTTVTNTVNNIDLSLTYYKGLMITGLPVSFEISAYNATADQLTWHIDSDISFMSNNDKLGYFHGHSHTGIFYFEYTFFEAGTFEINVDLFTSGDTTLWNESQAWGARSTTFSITITDGAEQDLKTGPTTLELKEINVKFTPEVKGEEIETANVNDLVDMSFLITFSNGTTMKHSTSQVIIINPDGQVVLGSTNVHEHTSNLQMSLKTMDAGVYRIIMYITPTMPGARSQIDYGRQVAVFGLEVKDSNAEKTPGFGVALAIIGIFLTSVIVRSLRKKY